MDYILPFTIILTISIMVIISFYFGYTFWLKNRKFNKSVENQMEALRFEKQLDKDELIKRALILIKND